MAIIEFGGVRLRPMTEADQSQVLAWRTDPEISRRMYTDIQEPSLARQLEWFRRVSASPRHEYWMIENRGRPVGVANLSAVEPEHARTDWAFYLGDPSTRGSGIGAKVEYAVIYYVFFHRRLGKLSCQVLSNNLEVVRLHEKFGFEREGVLRRHYCRAGEWLDVYLLALYGDVARRRGYDQKPIGVLEEDVA